MMERVEGPNAWPRTGIRTFSLVFLMYRSFLEEEESDDERINESEKGRKGRCLFDGDGRSGKERIERRRKEEEEREERDSIQETGTTSKSGLAVLQGGASLVGD